MIAIAYRRRALPIAWTWVRCAKGHSSSRKLLALLAYVRRLIPEDVPVFLVGDSEFGAVPVIRQLGKWYWVYVLRQKASRQVKLTSSDTWQRLGVKAVDEVSFDVHPGEIFGMVGPNGAGKTTTIECVEGLRRPDSGSIQVLGLDPLRDRYRLRERIGVQFQSAALPHRIKVWEALDLFAAFYRHSS